MKLKIERIVKGWGLGKNIIPANIGFIDNGSGRKFAKEKTDPFWLEAFSSFNLIPKYLEPVYQIFTGIHYLPGTHTHIHKDTAPKGFVHVRCNVMLKKPPSGGNPILDNEVLEVEEGDLWLCLASLERHGSTPISKPFRIIKSFGSLIPIYDLKHIIDVEKIQ